MSLRNRLLPALAGLLLALSAPARADFDYTVVGDFSALSPERQRAMAANRDRYEGAIVDLVREAQAEGAVARTYDARLIVKALLSSMNSLNLWYRPGGRATGEEVADLFADLLIGGLVSRA